MQCAVLDCWASQWIGLLVHLLVTHGMSLPPSEQCCLYEGSFGPWGTARHARRSTGA